MHWRRILFLLSWDALVTSRKIYSDTFKNKDWLHDITRIMISLSKLGCLLVWLLFRNRRYRLVHYLMQQFPEEATEIEYFEKTYMG